MLARRGKRLLLSGIWATAIIALFVAAVTTPARADSAAPCGGMVPGWNSLSALDGGYATAGNGVYAIPSSDTQVYLSGDVDFATGDSLAVSPGANLTVDLCGYELQITSPAAGLAAIEVPGSAIRTDSSLDIEDTSADQTGVLDVIGGSTGIAGGTTDVEAGTGAGIGGNGGTSDSDAEAAGNVEIDSGTVEATGGPIDLGDTSGEANRAGTGAGIGGGGGWGDCTTSDSVGGAVDGTILITGGTLDAVSGGTIQNIVDANDGGTGAGIGSGGGACGTTGSGSGGELTGAVTVNGGKIDEPTGGAIENVGYGTAGGTGAAIGTGGGAYNAGGGVLAGTITLSAVQIETATGGPIQGSDPTTSGSGAAIGTGGGGEGAAGGNIDGTMAANGYATIDTPTGGGIENDGEPIGGSGAAVGTGGGGSDGGSIASGGSVTIGDALIDIAAGGDIAQVGGNQGASSGAGVGTGGGGLSGGSIAGTLSVDGVTDAAGGAIDGAATNAGATGAGIGTGGGTYAGGSIGGTLAVTGAQTPAGGHIENLTGDNNGGSGAGVGTGGGGDEGSAGGIDGALTIDADAAVGGAIQNVDGTNNGGSGAGVGGGGGGTNNDFGDGAGGGATAGATISIETGSDIGGASGGAITEVGEDDMGDGNQAGSGAGVGGGGGGDGGPGGALGGALTISDYGAIENATGGQIEGVQGHDPGGNDGGSGAGIGGGGGGGGDAGGALDATVMLDSFARIGYTAGGTIDNVQDLLGEAGNEAGSGAGIGGGGGGSDGAGGDLAVAITANDTTIDTVSGGEMKDLQGSNDGGSGAGIGGGGGGVDEAGGSGTSVLTLDDGTLDEPMGGVIASDGGGFGMPGTAVGSGGSAFESGGVPSALSTIDVLGPDGDTIYGELAANVNIESGSTLGVPTGKALTLNGHAINNGLIDLAGELNGSGTLVNNGEIVGSNLDAFIPGHGLGNGGLNITGNAYELTFTVLSGTPPTPIWVFAPTLASGFETLPATSTHVGYTPSSWQAGGATFDADTPLAPLAAAVSGVQTVAITEVASPLAATISYRLSQPTPDGLDGWWVRPVTVRFSCTGPAGVLLSCPSAITLNHSGKGQSASGTVQAANGASATTSVHGINIDLTRPTASITGPKNGRTYRATPPAARCRATDHVSGISSCTLTRRVSKRRHGSERVTYTAVATSQSGTHSRKAKITIKLTQLP